MILQSHDSGRSITREGLRLSATLLALVSCLVSFGGVSAAQITHVNGRILFAGNTFVASFSDTNGSLLAVTNNGQTGTVFTGGELGLWSMSFNGGSALNATAFSASSPSSTFRWTADPAAGTLVFGYTNSQ